jgi:WD40 repeat protein
VTVDLGSGKVLRPAFHRFPDHDAMALSPDGSKLAYGASDGLVVVESAAEPGAHDLRVRGVPSPVVSLAWSPDGSRLLAIAGGSTQTQTHRKALWIVDPSSRSAEEVGVPSPGPDPNGDNHEYVLAASFSPDGRRLVILSDVAGECGHPLQYYGCECPASLYIAGVDGTAWRRLGDVTQGCAMLAWVR